MQVRIHRFAEIAIPADKVTELTCAKAVIMGPTQHCITPLHLSGNTTQDQNDLLRKSLGEAVNQAYLEAIVQLDRQSAQTVLDMDKKLASEVAASVVEIIQRHTASDKYKDE